MEKRKRPKTIDYENNGINVCQATNSGYIFCPAGGVFDMSYPKSKLRRGRVQENGNICPTLTCAPDNLIIVDSIKDGNPVLRKMTERECFRLMGIEDEDIDKLMESGISSRNLYKIAGNSIVTNVIENIFRTMFIEKEKGNSNILF
jgi:DNA (cytosine-5)-methyltransferase 1